MTIENLDTIIKKRLENLPNGSYVTSLYKKGENEILQKIGEEAIEVIIAAKGKSRKRIIEEAADLYFHLLLLLAVKKITLEEVYQELERRKKK